MTTVGELDALVGVVASYEPSSAQLECARLRLADACFGYQLGRGTSMAGLLDRLGGHLSASPSRTTPGTTAFELAACIRYTETDDILLASCVTPGAIVAPAAMAIAGAGPSMPSDRLLGATVVGYGVAAWCGVLCGGVGALEQGRWPSREIASLTAAMTSGRALGLDRAQLMDAALLASIWHVEGRLTEPARELSFARAVALGVEAAEAASLGVKGERGVAKAVPTNGPGLAGSSRAAGIVDALDRAIGDARVKLFCSAQQAVSGLLALKKVLEASGTRRLEEIDAIELELPRACAELVDRPVVHTRLESLSSIQYQAAAVVLDPSVLWDVRREELTLTGAAARVAPLLRVRASEERPSASPAQWGARATLVAAGQSWSEEVDDHPRPGGIDAQLLGAKHRAFLGADTAGLSFATVALEACMELETGGDLWAILQLIDALSASGSSPEVEPGASATAETEDNVVHFALMDAGEATSEYRGSGSA